MNIMSKNISAAEAIPIIFKSYAASLMASDPDRWISNWTEDCVQMPPGGPINVGKQMLYKSLCDWFGENTASDYKIFDDMEIQEAGDWAYAHGQFAYRLIPKDGSSPYKYEGKFLSIFKRQSDGEWKLHRDCFNSNTPDR